MKRPESGRRGHAQPLPHAVAVAGGTRVELVVQRRGRTLKGRLLVAVLRLSGRKVFCGDLVKTLRGLEQAARPARAPDQEANNEQVPVLPRHPGPGP